MLHHETWHFSGYVDGSYNYLVRNHAFISGVDNRNNDIAMNGFSLQQLAATVSKLPKEGLGALLTVVVGRDALKLSPNGLDSNVFNSDQIGATIPEAYLQYTKSSFAVKAGEMRTLAGIEQYDYTKDANFSRSILDSYAQPGFHVGVRGTNTVNEQLKLIVGLSNGWSTLHEPTRLTSFEAGVNYAPVPSFSFMFNIYDSSQYLTDSLSNGPTGRRYLIDFYATWNVTEKLSLATNLDYAMQTKALLSDHSVGQARWQGIAGYVNYIFTQRWRTSVRGEWFLDPEGYRTGVNQSWRELTWTVGYFPLKALELRAETRHDFSNKHAFFYKTGGGVNANQQSYALEALYQF